MWVERRDVDRIQCNRVIPIDGGSTSAHKGFYFTDPWAGGGVLAGTCTVDAAAMMTRSGVS